MHVIREYKELGSKISFNRHSPLQKFNSSWCEPFTWLSTGLEGQV